MISLKINNLRGIDTFDLSIPFEKGLYAITGENGIGKSTIFTALAKLVYKGALQGYFRSDGESGSFIEYTLGEKQNRYEKKGSNWIKSAEGDEIKVDGFYEGSLIFGSRFVDMHKSKLWKTHQIKDEHLSDADDFVYKNMGFILKNNESHYTGLKRVKRKELAKGLGFDGLPYFIKKSENWLSQLYMSSGELLLIGLLHFINERIRYKNRYKNSNTSLILIDEIELALHPSAQERLAVFLNKISSDHNLCIYFATHSVQIICNIRPERLFHIQKNISNQLEVVNPCYPAYATRSLYTNDGFDFLFLVEDELAKYAIDKIIRENSLSSRRLIKVLPCGSWDKTLELQNEMLTSSLAGKSCKIFSILDGDIKQECEQKYQKGHKFHGLQKTFLPIKSIEKFIMEKLITNIDADFATTFGDTFYSYRSLPDIISDFRSKTTPKDDSNGKKLFLVLKKCAEEQGYSDEVFKRQVCEFILGRTDFSALQRYLTGIVGQNV